MASLFFIRAHYKAHFTMESKNSLQTDGQNESMSLQDRLVAAGRRAVDLKIAKNERSWRSEMARAAGCSKANIYQAVSGKQKDMAAEYLKRIAIWSRVNEQWMLFGAGPMHSDDGAALFGYGNRTSSQAHLAPHAAERSVLSQTPSHTGTVSVTNLSLAPRISHVGRLGEVLYRANHEWPEGERRPFFTTKKVSHYCKFVLVNDDHMAPELKKGDWVLVDPEAPPERGKTCLFILPDDSYVIRYYEVIAGGGYEARDAFGRSLDRDRHGIVYAGRYILMQREAE